MISELLRKNLLPKSHNKDQARQEFILNILLAGSLLITFFAFCVAIFAKYSNASVQDGIPPELD